MLPLPITWPYATIFWAAYVWAFWLQLGKIKQAQQLAGTQDAGSFRLILIGGRIAEIAASLFAILLPAASLPSPWIWFVLGVGMIVLGGSLRRHCIRMLGEQFTSAVVVSSDRVLIERGAYRWVRHPSYTAGVVMTAGFGVAWGNWCSVAILVITTSALYAYRVIMEERALTAAFGDEYRRYMLRTKRFIPFVL